MNFQLGNMTIDLFMYATSIIARFWCSLLFGIMVGVNLIGCGATPQAPSEQDTIDIYQSAIRHVYLSQDKFLAHPDKSNLYIVRTVEYVANGRSIEKTNPIILPKQIELGLTGRLAALPSKIVYVDKFEQVELDPKTRSPVNKGIIVSLGKIQLHQDKAYVYISLYLAPLAGVGESYILEKKNGNWIVTGNAGNGLVN